MLACMIILQIVVCESTCVHFRFFFFFFFFSLPFGCGYSLLHSLNVSPILRHLKVSSDNLYMSYNILKFAIDGFLTRSGNSNMASKF